MENSIRFAVAPKLQERGVMLTSAQLAALADIAGPHAIIEMTSFHQIYIEMQGETLEDVTARLSEVGLDVYPVGFVTKSLIACHFCRGAEESGLDTAKAVNQVIAGIPVPSPMKIGYAGCGIATSEPLMKDIGIVKMRDTFDIYVGGEPKTIKENKVAQLFISGVTADELLIWLPAMIQAYGQSAKSSTNLYKVKGNKFAP